MITIIFGVMPLLSILATIANVCLHLVVKDLCTVPGLIIVMMSTFMILAAAVYLAWNITLFFLCKIYM